MVIRVLTPSDVEAFRVIRLEALRLEPSAYLTSAEEFEKRPLEEVTQRSQNRVGGEFMLGAFEDGQLVGTVGFRPEVREKV